MYAGVHPTFYVFRLQAYQSTVGDGTNPSAGLKRVTIDREECYEVERIVAYHGCEVQCCFLVKWKVWGSSEDI